MNKGSRANKTGTNNVFNLGQISDEAQASQVHSKVLRVLMGLNKSVNIMNKHAICY